MPHRQSRRELAALRSCGTRLAINSSAAIGAAVTQPPRKPLAPNEAVLGSLTLMLRRSGAWFPVSFRRGMVVCRQSLAYEQFSTAQPSLGHTTPCRFGFRITRVFGHQLAVVGMPQEFLRRAHRPVSCGRLRAVTLIRMGYPSPDPLSDMQWGPMIKLKSRLGHFARASRAGGPCASNQTKSRKIGRVKADAGH
jgi:hypothetical protein